MKFTAQLPALLSNGRIQKEMRNRPAIQRDEGAHKRENKSK